MKKVLIIAILLLLIAAFGAETASAYVIKGNGKEIDTAEVTINGKQYVLLLDVCEANGIEWEWDSIARRLILRKNGCEAVFLIGNQSYYAGGRVKELNAPVSMKNGLIYIPVRFAKYNMNKLFEGKQEAPRRQETNGIPEVKEAETRRPAGRTYAIRRVFIDPGHGGRDPGAIGRTGLYEKHLVLDVAKRVRQDLERNGIEVVMTRDSDEFISLGKRARSANEGNADFFISIHANSSRSRWLRGFEVYYLSEATDDNARALEACENSVLKYEEDAFARHSKDLDAIVWDLKLTENREESIELANFICQEVNRNCSLKNRGIRSARFYVLKGTQMPAVLVELSYLSNKWDEKNLKQSDYRQKIADGIALGVLCYKNEFERTNGFSR